ncbi:FAD-dependent oxidoreductase [Paenibacillus sp. L3-i20]|uniref:FAD-dependent oxidoreductase n=1 Tax=Paenibacillus sp. L3-i20 TaxID=2905833 RepID=UPI001EDCD2A1|nr:FAD-dependent oxidoreductase [Paenibacillus sp. L3-i20]GKU76587.1 monooxygenase [Paenibacillus sp. L3-i20]
MLSHLTKCCIVGGGPGGAILALLLARQGIEVTLLEQHSSFDRDFRGDVFHSSVMEIVDQLGLIDSLFQIPHTKIYSAVVDSPAGTITLDFGMIRSKFPHLTTINQSHFLEFIITEASRYKHFRHIMNAKVISLVEENDQVCGVRFRKDQAQYEVRSEITVAADGRYSTMRKLAGMEPVALTRPIDVIWFRIPRQTTDPEHLFNRSKNSSMLACVNRGEHWQMGMFIQKGTYPEIQRQGIHSFQQTLSELVPEFSERFALLTDWKQISILSASSSRLKKWYMPGLMFIGDAAHTMSPLGAVGINYAIQDAVVTANVLARPLREGNVSLKHLASIQKQRELSTKIIQGYQSLMQKQIIDPVLKNKNSTVGFKLVKRFRWLRKIMVILVGSGFKRVRIQEKPM